jgi:biopolymer transport protein ExbB
MWPLGLCSVIVITMALERTFRFISADADGEGLLTKVRELLGDGRKEEAIRRLRTAASPAAATILAAVETHSGNRKNLESTLDTVVASERLRLSKNLGFMGTIGNIAPFIGLFGTVLGIMRAFRDIGEVGAAGPAVVATGIAEALVATATGLFVAVMAVICFNFFTIWLERIMERTSILSSRLVAVFQGEEDAAS